MLTRAGNRLVASSSRSLLVPLSRPISTIAPALERHAGTRRSLRRDDTSHRYRSRPPSRFSPGPSLDYPDYEPGEPIGGRVIPSRPVVIPPDPDGVLQDSHAARELLAHDTLVIVRQIEMLNIFVGFEQANRYAIQTTEGELVGFLVEEEQSIVSTMTRQFLRTHRPFRAIIMDRHGNPILWIRRPFQFINSRIYVRAAGEENGPLVGEAQQEWHPWRRRYNVFQTRRGGETFSQFARIDGGFWAWDFWLKNKDDQLVASINRNFRGLGRELFTDTGQYVIRFDAAGTELDMPPGAAFEVQGQKLILPSGPDGSLTMDQRAMTLATAVSIDFDYFSRHSGAG
ncbi:Scramblase-domain-containing protein [Kockovaella imperatae]|uniref:Phospholipid scramblase n=1 Tax=Kockovaella imperatae TaxID=4999 RepID=A0A1Y1UI11_9TREE|nr:Scramblase-domain-containing protein [Kockovaella imperatae]ORX37703.1 Scramblase-domain-containing protein [Kockovaella imperatae]